MGKDFENHSFPKSEEGVVWRGVVTCLRVHGQFDGQVGQNPGHVVTGKVSGPVFRARG